MEQQDNQLVRLKMAARVLMMTANDLVQKVDKNVKQILTLSDVFSQVSRSVLFHEFDILETRIQKLVERYDACLNIGENYADKQNKELRVKIKL